MGEGLHGDLHELEITADDTALITIFDQTLVNLNATHMSHLNGDIVDGIVQEIDLATGQLMFEWRASDHLDDGEYLKISHGSRAVGDTPFDYFHINSVQKDLAGNYIVSLRVMHMVVCISGQSEKILWGLGGVSQDFKDLSDGKATDFQWQHDARWIDEERGIFGLFNNGISKNDLHAATLSEGRIIHLDIENKTARLLHSYVSLVKTKSISQGSFQYLSATSDNSSHHVEKDKVFIG